MPVSRIRWPSLLALCLALLCSTRALAEVTESGYVELSDGVGLKYTVKYPETGKRFPVLLTYNAYNAGNDPSDSGFGAIAEPALANGFAIMGVSVRGSGCSEGNFDLFEAKWGDDAVQVLDWVSKQPWSNGSAAMGGLSFPGITQLMVGPKRPPSLKAIMPFSAMTDLYRDVSWPGGIFNPTFAAIFDVLQREQSYGGLPANVLAGDARCAAAVLARTDFFEDVILQGSTNQWADSALYQRPVVEGDIEKISVPVFAAQSWQDEALASRMLSDYEKLKPETTWIVLGNGGHSFGLGSPYIVEQASKFLAHFVQGANNGFTSTPHVQILHEVAYDGSHRWITSHSRWPAAHELTELYFTADGQLSTAAPKESAGVSYPYPRPAPSMIAMVMAQVENQSYQLPVAPGGSASFTTAPLEQDVEILGPARADVWLSSTATDTDVQVSLIEVRADGQEQYLQRGWLRVSQRKTDTSRSLPNLAFHSHTERDSAPMPSGSPTLASVEIWPVGHVFRAGSSIRVNIEAPLGQTGFRQLLLNPTPSTNTVHVGGSHLSRITLPVIPKATAPVGYSECGTLWNEPCRQSPSTAPAGALSIRAALGVVGAKGLAQKLSDHRFRLTNTGKAVHYLRAVEASSARLTDGAVATLKFRDSSIAATARNGKLRFELEDSVGIAVGQANDLTIVADQAVARATPLLAGNVAYAGDSSGSGAAIPVGLLMLVLAIAAGARSRRFIPVAIVIGVLAACGDSTPVGSVQGSGMTITLVQAVGDGGEFFEYSGTPLGIE